MTDFTILLDRSGSMAGIRQATIDGFNKFVREQNEPGVKDVWSLAQFDTPSYGEDFPHFTFETKAYKDVPVLTNELFVPRGSTALWDAMCLTLDRIDARISALNARSRPKNVVIVTITDGYENASHRFTLSDVKTRIEAHKAKNRQFLFLGANIDAVAEGSKMGIAQAASMTYAATDVGTRAAYSHMSDSVKSWKSRGCKSALSFNP